MKAAAVALPLVLLLAACKPAPAPPPPEPAPVLPAGLNAPPRSYPPVEPIAPGQPGGLAGDRTFVIEGPIDPKSAQGAAQVVQTYFADIEAKDFAGAQALWNGDGDVGAMTPQQFADSFMPYQEYHAQIGAPGQMEGAAGSSYVVVPVQIYGRLKAGEAFHLLKMVQLRRVNDVDGATPEQLRWHITTLDAEAG